MAIDKLFEIPLHNHNGVNSKRISNPPHQFCQRSVQRGITANIGSTQATGTQVTADLVEISVCANAGDAIRLPYAKPGLVIMITNHGAQSADIFPNVGDSINEAAVNTAKALAADATMICYAYDETNWEALTLAR